MYRILYDRRVAVYLRSLTLREIHCTHTSRQQFVPLGCEVEVDAVHVAGQGGCPHQQHNQDQVRECCGEVHSLEGGRGSLVIVHHIEQICAEFFSKLS